VHRMTGGGVPLRAADGTLAPRFAKVAGEVDAAISDGAGGWFIGGHFTAVEGVPRWNLAHVLADGSVAAWDPKLEQYGYVFALYLEGNTLYVGGFFNSIGGRQSSSLASVDATTGIASSWHPRLNGSVSALAAKG